MQDYRLPKYRGKSPGCVKSLRIITNNSRIVLTGWFSVALIWVPDIPVNCRADELPKAGALLPESTSIHLHRSNWPSRRNFPETPTYPGSLRSPVPPLGSFSPQWIEGAPASYMNLVVTSFRSQWPCLQVTALRVDTWKECGSYLATSDADADPLRQKRLLSTFSVNVHLLRGADRGYVTLRSLSAWRSYRLLMSRI